MFRKALIAFVATSAVALAPTSASARGGFGGGGFHGGGFMGGSQEVVGAADLVPLSLAD